MTKTPISKSTAEQLIRISRELIKSGELKPSWTSDDSNTHVLSERSFIIAVHKRYFGSDRFYLVDDYNVPDSEEVRL